MKGSQEYPLAHLACPSRRKGEKHGMRWMMNCLLTGKKLVGCVIDQLAYLLRYNPNVYLVREIDEPKTSNMLFPKCCYYMCPRYFLLEERAHGELEPHVRFRDPGSTYSKTFGLAGRLKL